MKKENAQDSQIKLSVLVASVVERHGSFTALMNELNKQRDELGEHAHEVEFVTHIDNKEISIGAKRQGLLEKSRGKFLCFIDDDDMILQNYLYRIHKAITDHPDIDCVGIRGIMYTDGRKLENWKVSSIYNAWMDNVDGFRYVRCIHHWCPVRRDHALAVGFPDFRFGEDHPYSMGLREYCKNEYFIDENIYQYNYHAPRTHAESKRKYGIK